MADILRNDYEIQYLFVLSSSVVTRGRLFVWVI